MSLDVPVTSPDPTLTWQHSKPLFMSQMEHFITRLPQPIVPFLLPPQGEEPVWVWPRMQISIRVYSTEQQHYQYVFCLFLEFTDLFLFFPHLSLVIH